MSFIETPAQIELQEAAREVVTRVVAPAAASVPSGGKLTPEQLREMYRALRPLGYLGSTIKKDYGGAGLSYVDYGLLLEEIELMAADRQTGPAAPASCAEITFGTVLEERGPLFSHIVDLRT